MHYNLISRPINKSEKKLISQIVLQVFQDIVRMCKKENENTGSGGKGGKGSKGCCCCTLI